MSLGVKEEGGDFACGGRRGGHFDSSQRDIQCENCGRYGHMENDHFYNPNACGKGRGSQHQGHYIGNYGQGNMSQNYHKARGHFFAMEHIVGSMIQPPNDNDWFIDFGATNHRTC